MHKKNGRKPAQFNANGKKKKGKKLDPYAAKAAGYMTLHVSWSSSMKKVAWHSRIDANFDVFFKELLTQAHVPDHLKRKNDFIGPDPIPEVESPKPKKSRPASPPKPEILTDEEYKQFLYGDGR